MQVEHLPSTETQKSSAVLIIDDEADIVKVFKKSLDSVGYSTYGFVNPVAALEHFKRNPTAYKIIISDVRMPGLSGLELAREVRKINKDVKIVLISSFEITMPELDKVLPTLKIDAVMDKPMRLEKLRAVVETLAK